MTAGVRGDGLLPVTAYTRDDETPDGRFYDIPRKVVHIDDAYTDAGGAGLPIVAGN